MIIDKKYGLWWNTITKEIESYYKEIIYGMEINEATLLVDDGEGNLVLCTTYFFSDSLEEIENKIVEEKLIIPNYIKSDNFDNFLPPE